MIKGGAKSAQPIWDDYIIVTVTIDKSSGKLSDGGSNSRPEYFIDGTQPKERVAHEVGTTLMDNGQQQELF